MMKKKINLVIHPGFGRCGTTFLQKKIFAKSNYINLGKPRKLNDELIKLQYKVFIPKYSFDKIYPMNLSKAVRDYSEKLRSEIDKSGKTNFILSDENISDKVNYFGYFNFFLLSEIIKKLTENYDLKLKFIITIRSQWEIISSGWCADYRLRLNFITFQNYLKLLKSDLNLNEIYDYEIYLKNLKELFKPEILLLPLEELIHNKKNYLEKIENFLETSIEFEDLDPIKVNSFKDKNIKKYFILKPDIRQILIKPISSIHNFLNKNSSIYQKNFYKFKAIKKYYEPNLIRRGTFQISEDQQLEIKKIYEKSNKSLEKLFKLNLKQYDYF